MLLSDEDRAKFIRWLDNEVTSGEGMILQLKKVGGPATESIVKKISLETAGCKIVSGMLQSFQKDYV